VQIGNVLMERHACLNAINDELKTFTLQPHALPFYGRRCSATQVTA
jgi:hypothetical protein